MDSAYSPSLMYIYITNPLLSRSIVSANSPSLSLVYIYSINPLLRSIDGA